MDQYQWNEQCDLDGIASIESAIPANIAKGDFSRAVWNFARIAKTHVSLGLLHWRAGRDPRPDFQNAIVAHENMRGLARKVSVPSTATGSVSLLYAMFALIGRKTDIEFGDHHHELARWPCYECCLVHFLHEQTLDEEHSSLLDQYLAQNTGLIDRSFLTYFQLLEVKPADAPRDELVRRAERHWSKRGTDRFFKDSDARDGHGVMNDLYVDIYLAAVLKRIDWQGESVHRFRWA